MVPHAELTLRVHPMSAETRVWHGLVLSSIATCLLFWQWHWCTWHGLVISAIVTVAIVTHAAPALEKDRNQQPQLSSRLAASGVASTVGGDNHSATTPLLQLPARCHEPPRIALRKELRPRAFEREELVIELLDDPGDEYNVSPRTAYLHTPPASPLGRGSESGGRKSLFRRAGTGPHSTAPSHLRRESAELPATSDIR